MLWEHEPQASVSTAFSSSPQRSPISVRICFELFSKSFCCLHIKLKTPKVVPMHLVWDTRSLFFLIRGFWGLRVRLCRMYGETEN